MTLRRRAGTLLRLPAGILLVSWQYFWRITALHRSETRGDEGDLPPPIPPDAVDERSKLLSDGVGPMFHRRFRVRIVGARMSAGELAATVAANPNRAAPWTVAVFVKTRGERGKLRVGDEYRVQMPGPWDGPVRVVHSGPASFRLGTLRGHLEAGQIQFSARATGDGALEFQVEAWSRAGDRMAALLYSRLRVAKEIQFNMWVHFCLNAAAFSGGRPSGGVVIETRGVPAGLCRDADGR
ncbi:hypothetical protein DB35_24430 [Streptomyces abyssalis]|uniref:DUF1990 domain-containing protein n=1 Tax=Streptomyces abyssalis TaxID=933944 RepID=A0A1E7JNL2_9ACTN|nr:hypothetical protein DB35_24430 [Streptomyces abyssalis]OEU89830.1 hypothetical protein AN215_09120 [Streptomyces abyssalis]OEV04874.1 hypothetical protein AN219_36990 [Streptomyces nanshensis]